METVSELSKTDYDHWCNQVASNNVKVYKDEISYFKDGKEITAKKSELEPSPVEIICRI